MDIDRLLADFSRELDYFALTRDALQPEMEPLLAALERVQLDAADAVAAREALILRDGYLQSLGGVRPILDEWLRVRGSGERLAAATREMSAVQVERFRALLRRDAIIRPGRDRFDQLQDALQHQLAAVEARLEDA